jgi:16S rRNA (uracil1498-N3)-methyltransferase
MAERFYVNCPLAPGLVEVQGPEAHHLAIVCRLRAGDAIYLFNGDGCQYAALVETVAKRAVTLRIAGVEAPQRELGFRLELAVPLPKGDRAQWLVEKLTELGATALVPLRTRRSVVHPRDTKRDKLQRQVIEASKQCGRNVLMRVEELVDWEAYRAGAAPAALRVVAHPGGESPLVLSGGGQDVLAAVGPEGGFTEEEVAAAQAAGWRVIGLGPRILRVETAAVALAALLGCRQT